MLAICEFGSYIEQQFCTECNCFQYSHHANFQLTNMEMKIFQLLENKLAMSLKPKILLGTPMIGAFAISYTLTFSLVSVSSCSLLACHVFYYVVQTAKGIGN